MNEQEAIWFLFKLLHRILICKYEELTDEEEEILEWYTSYLNFPGREKTNDTADQH